MDDTGRRCGGCVACCRHFPIEELSLLAGQKCPHVRRKGCGRYALRPASCRDWSCRWLGDPDAEGLRRPDRCGYLVDHLSGVARIVDNKTGAEMFLEVANVWLCRTEVVSSPTLWKSFIDERLFEYLYKKKLSCAIRHGVNPTALMMFNPEHTGAPEWLDKAVQMSPGFQPGVEEMTRLLGKSVVDMLEMK